MSFRDHLKNIMDDTDIYMRRIREPLIPWDTYKTFTFEDLIVITSKYFVDLGLGVKFKHCSNRIKSKIYSSGDVNIYILKKLTNTLIYLF
jgi:hypothetical protein